MLNVYATKNKKHNDTVPTRLTMFGFEPRRGWDSPNEWARDDLRMARYGIFNLIFFLVFVCGWQQLDEVRYIIDVYIYICICDVGYRYFVYMVMFWGIFLIQGKVKVKDEGGTDRQTKQGPPQVVVVKGGKGKTALPFRPGVGPHRAETKGVWYDPGSRDSTPPLSGPDEEVERKKKRVSSKKEYL